jgi:hypothetical protein
MTARAMTIRAEPARSWSAPVPLPGPRRKYFEAVIERDDAPSLHHADREIVTIAVTDSHAGEFFAPGRHFTLWNGHDIGTGVVSRQVYTTGSPS